MPQVLGGPASGSKQHRNSPMAGDVEGCMHLFARGYEALSTADFGAAAVHFSSLTALLPGSLHALLCAAQALAGKGDTAAAAGGVLAKILPICAQPECTCISAGFPGHIGRGKAAVTVR